MIVIKLKTFWGYITDNFWEIQNYSSMVLFTSILFPFALTLKQEPLKRKSMDVSMFRFLIIAGRLGLPASGVIQLVTSYRLGL